MEGFVGSVEPQGAPELLTLSEILESTRVIATDDNEDKFRFTGPSRLSSYGSRGGFETSKFSNLYSQTRFIDHFTCPRPHAEFHGQKVTWNRHQYRHGEKNGKTKDNEPENPMFPAPHARTGESFPHPVVSCRRSVLSTLMQRNGRSRECTHSRGIRLGAGTINGPTSSTLTPVRSNRYGLGEPLDVGNIVRLGGPLTAGV